MLFVRIDSSHIIITRAVDGVRVEEKTYYMNASEFRKFLVKFTEEEIVVYGRHGITYQPQRTIEAPDDRQILMYTEAL